MWTSQAPATLEAEVPDWAVVTAASTNCDTVAEVAGAASLTNCHTGYESQRTASTVHGSNPASDPKGGRPSTVRNVAMLPLESASSPQPSAGKVPELDTAEKGTASQGTKHTELKSLKRTASPLVSRQQSYKSVVPDMPVAWTAAAGIKTGDMSDPSSSCCGGLVGSEGKRSRRCCSRAWWRFTAHSFWIELKKVVEVVRAKPLLLLPGLAVLGVVLGLGLWALIVASNSEERFRHESADKIATDKALYIQTELDKTFMPAYVVSTTVQQNPDYYPPQPPDLHQQYENLAYLANEYFDKLADDLIALTKAGSVRTVSAIPHGVIRTMYPLNGTRLADDRNWRAVGKNWLDDVVNEAPVKLSLTSHNLTIIGPYNLTQGGIGIVGMQAIFVNASKDDTFGIPAVPFANGSLGPTGPSSSIPGMLDLVWQPGNTDAPRFWGLCTVLISWDALRDNVTNLHDLEAQGYDYVLTRPHTNGTELAVDWSSGVDPPRPPGFDPVKDGKRPLIYYDLPQVLSNPVVVKVILPNVEWTLYVSRTGGWEPTWKDPLIAMIVILSLVLAALVFAVLVSRVQQRTLFREVVEAAGQLACTTRTLEEEKNRMQALLARHYDLIDLLEGGGGLAASMQGAGGGAEDDGGTRSRIDILRQKMLLSGTSLRREQLGEAEQITIQELLGEGTFGKVYKGLWRGTEVAIKTIVLPAKMSGKEKREKMAVMEAAISSSLAHPNIVQTYTYHIRPLRDSSSSAVCSVAPGATAAACPPAHNGSARASEPDSATVTAAEAPLPLVPTSVHLATKVLADQGAIVVGSPDASCSGTSPCVYAVPLPPQGCTANGGGGGSETVAAAPAAAEVVAVVAAAASTQPASTAAAAGGGAAATVGSGAPGSRRVSLDHPAGGGIHSYEVQLVLEFCDRGSLRDALDEGAFFSQGGLNYPAILETAADVAKAMLHLHLNDVLHSDLKATNVMLKSAGSDTGRGVIAKVADFGLSVRLDRNATHVSHTFQGSLTHMAPEVMLQGHISRPADVYAFGITMWEIFTGGQPYRGTPAALLGHQTSKEGRRPVFPLGTPAAYRELAERCWHGEAGQRPPFSEILDLLMKMRAEIPSNTPPLQPFVPLHKKMAAAMAQQQQKVQQNQQGSLNGGGGGTGGGRLYGSGSGYCGIPFNSGGAGASANSVRQLPKLSTPAAIQVGSRVLTLSQAMQSADAASGSSGARGSLGSSLGGGITLNGTFMGYSGGLETIDEEGTPGGELATHTTTDNHTPGSSICSTGGGAGEDGGSGGGGTAAITAAAVGKDCIFGPSSSGEDSGCGDSGSGTGFVTGIPPARTTAVEGAGGGDGSGNGKFRHRLGR